MKRIAILGSTGFIGRQVLDVVDANPEAFEVVALTGFRNAELLIKQARRYHPQAISCDARAMEPFDDMRPKGVQYLPGMRGIEEICAREDVDMVLHCIMGMAGLPPLIASLNAYKMVALANKESIVCAGQCVIQMLDAGKGTILPLDSEHNALFQALRGEDIQSVKRLWLTASGGPFREWPLERLKEATVQDALNHPVWRMGEKITIDSATMMNKGLEIIEAHYLFRVPQEKIGVLVHPQSLVHGLIEFNDGFQSAYMGKPDMRAVLQYTMFYPERRSGGYAEFNLAEIGAISFQPADTKRFPCIELAREALRTGHTAPAVLNGANEAAVEAFLQRRIDFIDIPRILEKALCQIGVQQNPSLEDIYAADIESRAFVRALLSANQSTAPDY